MDRVGIEEIAIRTKLFLWMTAAPMGIGIAIVAFGEIAIKRCNDGIGAIGFLIRSFPLADTRATRIAHDYGSGFFKFSQDTISFGRITHLFRSRINNELRIHLQSFISCIANNGCSPR
jgi:hypothetical protein